MPAWRAVWIPPRVEHVVTVVQKASLARRQGIQEREQLRASRMQQPLISRCGERALGFRAGTRPLTLVKKRERNADTDDQPHSLVVLRVLQQKRPGTDGGVRNPGPASGALGQLGAFLFELQCP